LKNSIYVTTKLKEGISKHKQNKCRYLVLDPDSGKTPDPNPLNTDPHTS
jgi:hypothetical protein